MFSLGLGTGEEMSFQFLIAQPEKLCSIYFFGGNANSVMLHVYFKAAIETASSSFIK